MNATFLSSSVEDKRQALSSAIALSRLLLSVAAGTIVLSGTLLQTIYVGRSLCLLEIAWVLLGVSLLLGYLVHGRYVTQLAKSDLTVRRGRVEVYSLLQFLAIVAGLVCFAIFVVVNVGSGPRLAVARADLGHGGRQIAVTLDCRSGADSGCQGEVTLKLARRPAVELGHAVFGDESDGPVVARVPLAPAVGRHLRRLSRQGPPLLTVRALASGRFGNETRETAALRLSLSGRRPPSPGASGRG
jgi:hypothetical protein